MDDRQPHLLRSKFEQRSFPHFDSMIFGECQTFLMNFEEVIGSEFGERVALKTGLDCGFHSSKSLAPLLNIATTHNSHRQFQKVNGMQSPTMMAPCVAEVFLSPLLG
jgi:hypothetical protein